MESHAVRALSYASLLDAVALPGMDEPCHATRHTPPPTPTPGACMTGPYQLRHPCSHLLPQRRIACTDGARGWACEQTLIDCAAGLRYALASTGGKAWQQHPRYCARLAVDGGARCVKHAHYLLYYVYHTRAQRLHPSKRSSRSPCSVCQPATSPYTPSPYTSKSRPHGRPPSLLPSARRPSVRYSGRAHTTHRKLTAHYPRR